MLSRSGKDSDKEINLNEEKRQREQILALNQVLAQQVLQKSRSASRGKSCKIFILIAHCNLNVLSYFRTPRIIYIRYNFHFK